jgi:glyoxylase-like metal-dependent hydrolase (beta-lactamase superfamily II)
MPQTRVLPLNARLLRDGHDPKPPAFLAPHAAVNELGAALDGLVDELGEIVLPYNCLLVQTAGELVLIDSGVGTYSAGAGNLERALADEGAEPGDVTIVLLTHAHPDHIGGLCVAGQPRFAKARHLMTRVEWEYWRAALAAGSLPPALAAPLAEQLRPVERDGLLELVAEDVEPVAGIRFVTAPGHTPGHVAVSLGAGDERMLFLADVAIHPVHFEHPAWTAAIDSQPSLAVETRERLFAAAVDEGLVVAASHLWQPGRVARGDDGFRFVPD